MAARRASLPGRSKMAPEVVQALFEIGDVALQLTEHVPSDLLESANPSPTADRPRLP
jgi:hypothetical protein